MIESTLFFALGFLSAGFLALMVGPAIWRRAVNITRRRIEASMPLSLNEIQAEKDKLRAEFAMSTRRLEMTIKALKEKSAEQAADVGRARQEIKRLTADRDERHNACNVSEARNAELQAELRGREDQLQQISAKSDEARRAMEARDREWERLNALYEEAQFTASSRQIELVARESEIERLNEESSGLKRAQREFERRLAAADVDAKRAAEAVAAEKSRVSALESKLERHLSTIADREEKLERLEKESQRLRGRSDGGSRDDGDTVAIQAEANADASRSDPHAQVSKTDTKGAVGEKTPQKAEEERKRLATRLTSVTRENKRLRAELAALGPDDVSDERRATTLLREQISDLAAEVVNMTIMLEGEKSATAKALAKKASDERPLDADGKVLVSLADRVRALQKAAAPRE